MRHITLNPLGWRSEKYFSVIPVPVSRLSPNLTELPEPPRKVVFKPPYDLGTTVVLSCANILPCS